MVWKNFKNLKLKTPPHSNDIVPFRRFSKGKKVPIDGIIRPGDSREKLTFIERISIKKFRRNKRIKSTRLGNELLTNNVKVKSSSIYDKFLAKSSKLLFIKNSNVRTSPRYVQNSSIRLKKKLYGYKSEKNKPFPLWRSKSQFERFFFKKAILFRSFWVDKFLNTLVVQGRKSLVWRTLFKVFLSLKILFGRSPSIILFEILENYKIPLRALPPKNKTRKVIVRVHMVSWWKQYMQVMRWIRQSTRSSHKMSGSWESRVFLEISSLVTQNSNNNIIKKIDLNNQLIAFGRVSIHFRWYRRYSRRKIKMGNI